MIGYDLQPSEKNVATFVPRSRASGVATGIALTQHGWALGETAAQIRDVLKQYLKEGDRLLITGCGEEAAWHGFKDSCQTWLEDNLQGSNAVR